MTKKSTAPAHLQPETRKWFSSVLEAYDLDEHHRKLLQLAAESWDRAAEARQALAEHGMVYSDRFGQPHARPEIAIARDATVTFSRLIRELDLDVEPPAAGRRPPSLRANRR